MTTLISGSQLRDIGLGRRVQGKTSTVAGAGTHQLFTVAGGEVLITSLYGKVTTAITGATGTYALQVDPTAGDTDTVVTATALGATDVTVGTLLGVRDQGDGTTDFAPGQFALSGLVVAAGEIELVAADATADGVIEWYATYVPLTDGATLAASA
jgi:hypothetical protein